MTAQFGKPSSLIESQQIVQADVTDIGNRYVCDDEFVCGHG